MKPVQYFSEEYLAHCKTLTPDQILIFLEEYRSLHEAVLMAKTELVQLRLPLALMGALRYEAEKENISGEEKVEQILLKWVDTVNE